MGPFSQLSLLLCRPSWTHTYTHVHYTFLSTTLARSLKERFNVFMAEMETEAPPRTCPRSLTTSARKAFVLQMDINEAQKGK